MSGPGATLVAGGLAAAALCAFTVTRGLRRRAREGRDSGCVKSSDAAAAAAARAGSTAPIGDYFGMDIGGSLTKIVFFSPDSDDADAGDGGAQPRRGSLGGGGGGSGAGGPPAPPPPPPISTPSLDPARRASLDAVAAFLASSRTYGATGVRDGDLAFHSAALRGTFHFLRCETSALPAAMALVEASGWHHEIREMCATGGGAQKYAGMVRERLGVTLVPGDELGCLVRGMAFLLASAPDECYVLLKRTAVPRPLPCTSAASVASSLSASSPFGGSGAAACFPYLVVNVGSGVSVMLVSSEREWRRVSGSSIGGGTYYGLCHLLTGLTSFDEMLAQSEMGDNMTVDLTVGDIYGGARAAAALLFTHAHARMAAHSQVTTRSGSSRRQQ